MASLLDSLRSLGRRVLGVASSTTSAIAEGASRAYASFGERIDRQAWQVRQQRGWLPAGQGGRNQRHLLGERAFATMMRGAGGIGWPGANLSDRSRQVLYFRRWVYVAAERIGDKIASLPPRLGLVHQAGQQAGDLVSKSHRSDLICKSHVTRWKRYQKSLHAIKPHEEVEEVGPDHPLYRILMRPNAWEPSAGQLWKELVLFLLITGNAYMWIVPDRAFGMPLEMWIIPSQWVFGPKLNAAGLESYRIMPYIGGVGQFDIPADEIIHFQLKSLLSKIDGFAPLQAGAEWVDVAEAIDQSRYFEMQNGVQAKGSLELDPNYQDPDDADIEAIGAKLLARYQGIHNAGMPVILPPGVKMVPLTIAPSELGWETSFEQMRDSILSLFGVPKEVAGIVDAGSHTAMWGPLAQFAEHAIVPKLKYIGEVLSATLCKRWDDHLRLWWDDPTPNDPVQQNADLSLDLQYGIKSLNEARAERGLEPVEDPMADELLVDPNKIPLSMLKERLDQAAKQQDMMAQAKVEQAKNPQQPGGPGGSPATRQGRPKNDEDEGDEPWMAPNRPLPWNKGPASGGPGWNKSLENGNGHTATLERQRVLKSAPDGRITRDDFGFASPPDGMDVPQFAQCETCHKFTGRSCMEFSPSEEIIAGGACDLYVYGLPIGPAGVGHESGGTTPEDAGYVERQVRCENCARSNAEATRCEFYEELNKSNAKRFSLDTVISPQSCCSAQTPK